MSTVMYVLTLLGPPALFFMLLLRLKRRSIWPCVQVAVFCGVAQGALFWLGLAWSEGAFDGSQGGPGSWLLAALPALAFFTGVYSIAGCVVGWFREKRAKNIGKSEK